MACFEWFYSGAPPFNLQVLAACIFLMGTFTKIEHVLFSTLQDIYARCIIYTMKVQLATFSKNRKLSNNFARQLRYAILRKKLSQWEWCLNILLSIYVKKIF